VRVHRASPDARGALLRTGPPGCTSARVHRRVAGAGDDGAAVVARTAGATHVLTHRDRLVTFDHALAPARAIAADRPVLGHAARTADDQLTVVAADAEGRRAYLRSDGARQVIER
jgi:hypothetical protein